jgi:predicted nucleic acid-binding protein
MTVPLNKIFIFLDDCSIEPRDDFEKIAFNKIFSWREIGTIIDISPSVQEEVNHLHTPLNVKRAVNELGYTTVKADLNDEQKKRLGQIIKILAGNGNAQKIHNDAVHISAAYENAGNYFVTLDDGILKKKEPIHELLATLIIIKPSELVKKYENEYAKYLK